MRTRSTNPLRTAAYALALVGLCSSSGCTVFSDYNASTEEALANFEQGDFDGATAIYSEDLDASNDSLLYHLEAAMAAHVGGRFDQSFKLFDVAYRKVEEYQDRAMISASDVAQTVGSILVNEKTIPYTGVVFEQLMMQTYQARNLFLSGKKDMVLTEVLRCYDIQKKARKIYEEELKTTQAEANKESREKDISGADIEAKMRASYSSRGDLKRAGDVYDPYYVRYLNAFLRDACGDRQADFNDALIDLKFVSDRFGDEEFVIRDLARLSRKSGDPVGAREYERRLSAPTPPDAGSLALFFEGGMAPRKKELKITFPTLNGAAAVAIPLYEPIPDGVAAAELIVGDHRARTVTFTNLESVAFRYFSDRVPLMVAKQIIRVAAKIAIQEGGHAIIKNQKNSGDADQNAIVEGLALLWDISASIWNVVSEQADLRCWRTLPRTLQATRIYLPEGRYPVTLRLLSSSGASLSQADLGWVTIKAGEHRMINARSIGARVHWVLPPESYDQAPADEATADSPMATEVEVMSDVPVAPSVEPEGAADALDAAPTEPPETAPGDASDERRAPAPTAEPEEIMDALKRGFHVGGRLNLTLSFERGPAWSANTTIDEVVDRTDARGRYLAVSTANYRYRGRQHYFSFVIRDGEVKQLALMVEREGAWKQVAPRVFRFRRSPGAVHRLRGESLVLVAAGAVSKRRGSTQRVDATLEIRTGHVAGAGELAY